MWGKNSGLIAHLEAHSLNTDLQKSLNQWRVVVLSKVSKRNLILSVEVDGGRLELIIENLDRIIKMDVFPYRCNKDWLTWIFGREKYINMSIHSLQINFALARSALSLQHHKWVSICQTDTWDFSDAISKEGKKENQEKNPDDLFNQLHWEQKEKQKHEDSSN